jgi:hypothetical protein
MSPNEKEGTRILAKPFGAAPNIFDAKPATKGGVYTELASANFSRAVLKLTYDC